MAMVARFIGFLRSFETIMAQVDEQARVWLVFQRLRVRDDESIMRPTYKALPRQVSANQH